MNTIYFTSLLSNHFLPPSPSPSPYLSPFNSLSPSPSLHITCKAADPISFNDTELTNSEED